MASKSVPTPFLTAGDANADLTGQENKIVVLNSSGKWALAGAAAGGMRGVLTEGALANRGVSVQWAGMPTALCGGTFASGVSVTTNASALLVAATTGQSAIGYARDAGASGTVAAFFLIPHVAL